MLCEQAGRHGKACMEGLRSVLGQLVLEMAYSGRPDKEDVSLAAQLLRVSDPDTGAVPPDLPA